MNSRHTALAWSRWAKVSRFRHSSRGVPLTDAQRLEFVGRSYKHRFAVASKCPELAEKHPNDPVALDALILAVWQVNGTPWPVEMVGEDTARPRAFENLQRDHVRSDKLGLLCQRIAYGTAGSTSRSSARSWPRTRTRASGRRRACHSALT